MNEARKNQIVKNLEFQITFAETNIAYLSGEPESESRERKIAFNKKTIQAANAELERLTGEKERV